MAANRGSSWSREEVEATVADYLRMMRLELAGQPYNKAAHNRALLQRLNHRSRGAVELKHQNISAILLEQRMGYIPGYKPLGNYQRLLADVVLDQIEHDPALEGLVLQAVERMVVVPDLDTLRGIRVPPPRITHRVSDKPRQTERPPRKATKRDYLLLESQNRSKGTAGELFIVDFEARRLHAAGHKLLADRVEHVADTRGDGLGYDVLSFDVSGQERFLEVKTTDFGAATPFYVSRNEVAFSDERGEQFILARVHEFRSAPKFFELKGPIRKNVLLDAVSFVARLQAT
jgi:hypothetical protein